MKLTDLKAIAKYRSFVYSPSEVKRASAFAGMEVEEEREMAVHSGKEVIRSTIQDNERARDLLRGKHWKFWSKVRLLLLMFVQMRQRARTAPLRRGSGGEEEEGEGHLKTLEKERSKIAEL